MNRRPSHSKIAALARRAIAWTAGGALLVAAALSMPHAHAALYKWVDANGRVVYSDIPPSGDVKAERMNTPSPRANPNAAKELVSQEADLKKRQMQRAEDDTKAEKAKTDNAKRTEQCNLMRGQLKALQMDNLQHYRINEKGERVLIDAATRKQQAERVEAYLREHCQSEQR